MGNVIVTMFVSLDGVVEAPEKWSSKYWNDDIAKLKHDELFGADALLLGSATYEGFAGAWPQRSGEFADKINGLPKHVASTTLKNLEWNNSHLIEADLARHVSKLKQTYARDILVYGGGTMVSALAGENLVDEYRRLFKDGTTATLTLTESRTCHPNVVFVRYRPAT